MTNTVVIIKPSVYIDKNKIFSDYDKNFVFSIYLSSCLGWLLTSINFSCLNINNELNILKYYQSPYFVNLVGKLTVSFLCCPELFC